MSVSDVRDSGFSKREVAVSQTDISSATPSSKYHRVLMPRMNLTQSAEWRRGVTSCSLPAMLASRRLHRIDPLL